MFNEQNGFLDDEFSENTGPTGSSVRNRRKDKQEKHVKRDSIKIRLFKIYYQLMKERSVGAFPAFIMILILFMQIYDLILSPIMKLPFKGALYVEISTVFDTIRIYPLVVRMGNTYAYWFFMIKLLVLIVLYFFALLLLDYKIRKKSTTSTFAVKTFLQNLSMAFQWVLVIPITDFFISIYECDANGDLIMDSTFKCWTGNHALYCALFSVGLLLYCLIIFIISFLFTESRPYYTDSLRLQDNNEEVYLALYRIVLTVVSHYTTGSKYQWLILALHLLMSAHLLKNQMKYIAFYSERVSTMYEAGCVGYIWVSVNGFIIKAFENVDYRGQIIVVSIGFIFMYPTAYYLRKRRVDQIIMSKAQDKIKSDLELDQFVVNFQNFILKSELNGEEEMMLLGFLFMHREECQSTTCPLKSNDHLYLPLLDQTSQRTILPSKDKILHQHLLNSVFLDYAKAHQNTLTAVMHTSYAYFLFFQMGNIHMALIELNLAQKCKTSIQQAFTIFKCRQLIEDHLIKRFKSSKNQSSMSYSDLDVTIVITFEGLFTKMEKSIEQSATDHIEFWSHLDSNMIDLNVINKLGLNIINQTKKVNELWIQLKKINPNYPNALYLYGNYLSQIKNDVEQGEDYKNTYLQVKKQKSVEDFENQFDIMFAEETAVIVMSGNKEQQGKIIKTNQGIFKLFGYSMFEVQGHDVNVLMPSVLAMKHNYFLEKFIKTGKEKILNNCFEVFAMYRTGIIFPISLVVKPVPSLRNDIQYIGMIKRSGKDFEYILTDENGKIDSISEGIISLFKLPISFFKEHEIPIQVIIPELCEVSRMKGTSNEPITNFEAWNGLKELRFFIPKNFSNSANRATGIATSSANRGGDGTTEDAVTGTNATGTGTGTGTQTSSSSKAKNMQLLGTNAGQAFTGLRNPESLKSISNMFKNAEHKGQPDKYKNNLLNHVNYGNPDFDKLLKTDMQTTEYSDGDLKIKVFKIFINKKKKGQLGKKKPQHHDSTTSSLAAGKDEETMMHQFGMSGMSTLNDKFAFQKYNELVQQAKNMDKNFNYKRLQHDIDVLKILLERQRKVRTYGNIMTPPEYEQAELERMIQNIQILEGQISELNSESSKIQKHGGMTTGTEKSSGGLRQGINQGFISNWGQQLIKNNDIDEGVSMSAVGKEAGGTTDETSQLHKATIQIDNLGSLGKDNQLFHKVSNSKNMDVIHMSQQSPQFKKSRQEDEDKKEGEDESMNEQDYDDNLDEESKSMEQETTNNKENATVKSPLIGAQNVEDLVTGQGSGSKMSGTKKSKEDPRKEFVHEYFMQNQLNPDVQNKNVLKIPQSMQQKKLIQQNPKKSDQIKQAYQVDLQNEILRNLHEKNKINRNQSRRDENSSYPDHDLSSSAQQEGDTSQSQTQQKQEETQNNLTHDTSSLKLVEDTGSVSSDTKTLMRHLRVLRHALYENYSPQSILNLQYSARFVLVVLVAMTIASFIFSKQKYNQLKNNFYMIQASEQRMQSITTINSDTRACTLMQNSIMNRTRYGVGQDYLLQMQTDINDQAIILQLAQNNLSNTQYDFSDQYKYLINAQDIILQYDTYVEMGNNDTVNIWSAVMQIAVNSYKVKSFALSSYLTSNLSIWFILTNSMNNILESVSQSTDGILQDTGILSEESKEILMVLLIVASGCLLASMIIIMPVVTKVHKDKDKLLSLFLQIDPTDVKEQLKHCKDFFSTFHNDEKHGQNADQGFEFEDDEKKEGDDGVTEKKKEDGTTPSSEEEKKLEEKKQKEQQLKRFSRKGKKHKKYSTNYFTLLLKFLAVVSFLESYFLYQYFQSGHFLQNSLSMIKEAASIADRRFSNFLLYQIFVEILATNGTANVFNANSVTYITNYIGEFNMDLENFLAIHSNNTNIHDATFNTFFNELIYQSVCDTISTEFTSDEQSECGDYLGGILNKGLYSANLAFWDNIREMMDSYTQSSKSQSFIKDLINGDRLVQNEQLNLIYFQTAYDILMDKLNQSILIQFQNRDKELTLLFAFYLFLLVLLYFILWGKFVESMRHSLWVTKSMLAIIPLEVIEKVKAIKDFLMTISRAAMNSIKD